MKLFGAIVHVLQEVGKPIHINEITKLILSKNLWEPKGNNPTSTVDAKLNENIEKKGDASPFIRVEDGIFGLKKQVNTPADYTAICEENLRRYGTDINRIGRMLLAGLYADRTHFIFEILQNAEDACAHSVTFNLTNTDLKISHFGRPFNERDVRGICGIDESTKNLNAIGRFGIGFKSVYAFTDRPEIHSGLEHFAIEKFVQPVSVPLIKCREGETAIVLPLKNPGDAIQEEIESGLRKLGARVLLFLRRIEKINWHLPDGTSGHYLRSKPEDQEEGVRRINIIGQCSGKPDIEESWLIFSRRMTDGNEVRGNVEIAFNVVQGDNSDKEFLRPLHKSFLTVFFPTVIETHLGFLIQGPYRTTPSRDTVPLSDSWNQDCVRETAALLVESLRWLRDCKLLDTKALQCLPLDSEKFSEGTMFSLLFQAAKDALTNEPLLPRFGGGYVSADQSRLARTQDLRELLNSTQLAILLNEDREVAWLSRDITHDRTLEFWQYLNNELGIKELRADAIIQSLDKGFLEAQSDEWIQNLYEFLNGQPALKKYITELPLIRLENGTHEVSKEDDQIRVFLPGPVETGFPTVCADVCISEDAKAFLMSLGLTEPDPVDDIIWHILPKYRKNDGGVGDAEYKADIQRILKAFSTDSKAQREKLVDELRETSFVKSVEIGGESKGFSKPNDIYISTKRLNNLFAEIPKVLFVDNSHSCLQGEGIRDLLVSCGAARWLKPVESEWSYTETQLEEIRHSEGLERASWQYIAKDKKLRGLESLLNLMPELTVDLQREKAGLLWDALIDVERQRGRDAFLIEYQWSYSHTSKEAFLDAYFVRKLRDTAWVPDPNGRLQRPERVLFDDLGWEHNPFLQSKILFKPLQIDALAREFGIEPDVLLFLKEKGITREDLLSKFGDADEQSVEDRGPGGHGNQESVVTGGDKGVQTSTDESQADNQGQNQNRTPHKRTPGSVGGRPFVSYVAVHSDDSGPDPDKLDQITRTALEDKAIARILAAEPKLQRMARGNRGFDLCEMGSDDKSIRWIEVKAMTGSLHDRPAGLSHTQFKCAQEHGEAYWLYVVEYADNENFNIVKIQNPAGKAKTFTFDHGWLNVATEIGKQK